MPSMFSSDRPRGDPAELISLDIAGQQLILEEIQIEEDQHSGQHDASADEKPLFLDAAAHQHDEQRDADDQADAGIRLKQDEQKRRTGPDQDLLEQLDVAGIRDHGAVAVVLIDDV